MTDTQEDLSEEDMKAWGEATKSLDLTDADMGAWNQAIQNVDRTTYPQAIGNVFKETAKGIIPGMAERNPEALNDAQRMFAQKQPFWNVAKAFGHGYGETYEAETEENIAATHDAFMKDYVERSAPISKALVDGFVIPAAKQAWTTYMSAPFAGAQEALHQTGLEVGGEQLGADLAAMPDAFVGEAAAAHPVLPKQIARAKANAILEDEAIWAGTKEPLPGQTKAMEEAAIIAHDESRFPPVAEQKANIIADVKKDLVAVGRPEEEAHAVGQLVAEHYAARAERFGYQLGSAEEMYAKSAPEIVAGKSRAQTLAQAVEDDGIFVSKERGENLNSETILPSTAEISKTGIEDLTQTAKGKIRLAKDDALAQITLFKNADASTVIHETGHHWLDELVKDSQHELAPDELVKDAETVRTWLGSDEGPYSGFTKKQHEKFARGFERYMMEGVAPSEGLVRVFSQFKDWLTRLYQTVQRLRTPLTDDVRAVFDRLLAKNPEKIQTGEAVAGDAATGETVAGAEGQGVAMAAPAEAAGATDEAMAAGRAIAEQAAAEKPPEGAAGSPAQILPAPKSELIDKAGNIRLENLAGDGQFKQALRQLADENDNFMAARGGIVTDQHRIDAANAMGIDANKLNIQKLNEAYLKDGIPPSVRVEAARRWLPHVDQQARDAFQKVTDMGDRVTDEALMELADARRDFLMISNTLAGVTSEWGRTGRAFRNISKEQRAQTAEMAELFQKMTGMTMEQMRAMAKNPKAFDTAQKMAKLLQKSTKPGFFKMLFEYRQSVMLSNPLTHVKNAVSNATLAASSVVETAVAAGVGKVLRSEDRVYLGEAKEMLFAINRGAIDGWQTAKAMVLDEDAITGNRTVENIYQHAIPGQIGKAVRIPLRLLSASDELFKGIAFRQELQRLAYRSAKDEGLAGDAFHQRIAQLSQDPTEAMMKAAKENADYQTLTKGLTGFSRNLQTTINSNMIAKNIVPFYRTNVNSLKYFVGERTPLGLLSKEIRANIKGENGTIARDTQIARMAVGTSVLGVVHALSSQGLITGGGAAHANETADEFMRRLAFQRMTGWAPYSLKIGNGYYSYEWLQGFSTPVGMAADVSDVVRAGIANEDELTRISGAASMILSKRIMNISSLSGVSDTVKALDNPEGFAEKYIQNYIGSYVPGLVGQIARVTDPDVRELRGGLLTGAMSRIPGLREEFMAKRDIWGEIIQSQGNFGPDLISPIYQSRINTDPVNQRLIQLGYFPAKADRTIRGVQLTDQQYDDYVKISGRLAKQRLNIFVGSPGSDALPPGFQIDRIRKIMDQSREQARKLVMMRNPEIHQQAYENKRRELTGTKR